MSVLQDTKPIIKKGRGRGILARVPNKAPGTRKELSLQSLTLENNDVNNGEHAVATKNNPSDVQCSIKTSNENKKETVVESNNTLNNKNNSSGQVKLIAKYNYKANPDRPGGFDELSLNQGENLLLITKGHQETNNIHWWQVRNEGGQQGYVPGNYCLVLEEKVTSLPWLESQRIKAEKEEQERMRKAEEDRENRKNIGFGMPENHQAPVKQYVSAYSLKETPQNAAMAKKEYYCDICDKNLNGPTPYKMHMSSKAHREEVEYQNSKN